MSFLPLFDYNAVINPGDPLEIVAAPQARPTLTISNGGWNGDFVLSASGDLQLSQDQPGLPQATYERITRLINTTPRRFDGAGNPISRGDYPGHPTWGAGLPVDVDELSITQLATSIQQHILHGLTQDSAIASVPPPRVVVQVVDTQTLSVAVQFTLSTGQPVSINGYTLPINARAGN